MQLLSKIFPPNYNIFLIGDTHEGTILQAKDALQQTINMVLEPYDGIKNNYVIHHGDEIEAFTVDHKFYNIETSTEPIPLQQARAVIEDFKPIRKNILAWLLGNHSWYLNKFGNITRDVICKELGCAYATYSCKYSFLNKQRKIMWKLFATHGRKGINSTADDPSRREANMKLMLKRHLQHKAADVLISSKGHSHKLLVLEPTKDLYLYDDGVRLKKDYTKPVTHSEHSYIPDHLRWYVSTGSFLKTYELGVSSYAEMAEYDPVEIGFAVAKIRDHSVVGVDKIIL